MPGATALSDETFRSNVNPNSIRTAFVVGVTGNMNPCGYTDALQPPEQEDARIRAIRQNVTAILDWIFADPTEGHLDPATGAFDSPVEPPADVEDAEVSTTDCRQCWRPLGLRHTPVVFLSSLAPGVDTLVVETVLDYAERHPAPEDPKHHIMVRAPLPFPVEHYRQATTFHPEGKEATWKAKEERLHHLLTRLRAQPGWEEERDLFCVALDKQVEGDPATDLEAIDPRSGQPRRNLRYRAAGEYVASQSDLLLAVYDHESDGAGTPENLYEAGTATIVAAKLQGLTRGLLAESGNVARPNNSPVLRVAIRREQPLPKESPPPSRPATSPPAPRLAFLHPMEVRAREGEGSEARTQAQGDFAFRRMVTLREETNQSESWLHELFRTAGVDEAASYETIQQRMDALAVRVAPVARSRRNWLLFVAALSVASPLVWLSRGVLGVSAATAALATGVSALVLVGALWRVRWRGMQRTWARARLVSEVARSEAAVAGAPRRITRPELDQIPPLQSLLSRPSDELPKPWTEWRDDWIRGRLDGQLRYFMNAKAAAEKQRRKLTRWSTLFMDVMLALAVAGAVVAISPRGQTWLRLLGGAKLECFLGVAGALLPLGLILTQTLRSTLDLNRRTARFARQIVMLEKARPLLLAARDGETAMAIVEQAEAQLLAEVVDWYFEAETAEQLFQVREKKSSVPTAAAVPKTGVVRLSIASVVLGGGALLFLLRVLLGRAPWVLGASAGTLLWLAYFTPSDAESRSKLHAVGALIDADGEPWLPSEGASDRGCIIIAHGLHGGVRLAQDQGAGWMRTMAAALESRLGDTPPSIGLVDWHLEARPSEVLNLDPGLDAAKFAADVAGIRQQAREVGDFLAFRLSQLVLEKKLRRDRPLHFIGHSAGGFLVARAALTLHRINLAPASMQVTLLDTPGADDELLKELPAVCPVDFYITSKLVMNASDPGRPGSLYLCDLREKSRHLTVLQAHTYACHWFIETIKGARAGEAGFGRSIFLPEQQAEPRGKSEIRNPKSETNSNER